MAAADKKRTGTYNFKRKVSVMVAEGLLEADILVDGLIPFHLPDNSFITGVSVNVTTVSGTGSSTVDVLVGSTVIANEVPVTVAGATVANDLDSVTRKFATGGDITLKAGAVTPADGALVCDLIIEYIELSKKGQEYTQY